MQKFSSIKCHSIKGAAQFNKCKNIYGKHLNKEYRLPDLSYFYTMLNSYKEAIEFLYSQLPVFQNIGPSAYKKDLTNTIKLCQYIGNPQGKFKSIHIAGTNGKGSSAHMIASVLQTSSYKTGLYTSPHLKDFTERVKINGQLIQKKFVVDFVNRMLGPMEEIKPSFFELTVAMAFEYFAQEKVDFAVIETGLGGRLDSTNIIKPEISLITNIGYDHMDILGDKLETIAWEKAGIIKDKIPVVISERQPEIQDVFINQAKEKHAEIIFASDQIHLTLKTSNDLVLKKDNEAFMFNPDLTGSYQQKNIKGVLQVCLQLKSMGYNLSEENIINGINHAAALTGLKGRWQKIGDHPAIYCDTGHNSEGISEVLDQIKLTPHNNLRWVFGVVKDKPPDKVLSILPKNAFYYFCQAKIERAMDANELYRKAEQYGLRGKVIGDVNEAINNAKQVSAPDDLIVVGGSNFVVAEVDGI